jgi:hypothetical protein
MYLFYFLLISFCIITHFGVRERAKIVSPLYVYVLFTALYTLFPLYYIHVGSDVVEISMPKLNAVLVNQSAYHVLFINFIITSLLYLRGRFFRVFLIKEISSKSNLSNIAVFLFISFSPVVLFLVYHYPWPKFDEPTTIFHTVATFSKTILLLTFCSCSLLCYNKKLKPQYLTLFLFIILLVNLVDTARTHMFIAIFSYFLGCRWDFHKAIKKLPFVFILFITFVYLTLSRTSIGFSFSLLLWPFFSEAIFGSYGTFQVISLYESNYDLEGSSLFFFIDIISQFIPASVLSMFPSLDYNYLANNVVSAISVGALQGKLYPLGGHFFLSEYIFYFGYAASPMFVLAMFVYLKIIEKLPVELYIFLLSSFFLVIKAPTVVVMKMAILAAVSFFFFFVLNVFLPKKCGKQ